MSNVLLSKVKENIILHLLQKFYINILKIDRIINDYILKYSHRLLYDYIVYRSETFCVDSQSNSL